MTYLKVQWKGHPHHHPHIRVISSHSYAGKRTIAQVAAEQAVRRPFSPPLIKARRRQVCKVFFQTRTSPNSRRSSSTIITIRKKSSRAKQRLQVYGWDSSTAEVANFVQGQRHSFVQVAARGQPRSALPAYIAVRRPPDIPSVDGAACSTSRVSENSRPERGNREITVNFSNAPSYATTNHIPPRITTQSPTTSTINTRPCSVYIKNQEGRYRTYDSRIAPANNLRGEQYLHPNFRPAKSVSSVTKPTGLRRPTHPRAISSAELTRPNLTSEKPPTPMNVNTGNPKALSQLSGNSASISAHGISISRTPSERRALRKFTKELERHLEATRNLPQRASLASVPSITTTISIHTIAELEPYKSEFHTAGLAITSAEQRGMPFGWSGKNKRAATPPPVASRPERSRYGLENAKSSKKPARQPSYASGSTGTTILGYTPPHEKTFTPRTPIQRRHSSSDHTIIGFTPPHEMVDRVTSSDPRQYTKKSLPWLRKEETPSPDTALARKKTVHDDDVIKNTRIASERNKSSTNSPSPKLREERTARHSPGSIPNRRLSPSGRKEIPAVNRELSIKPDSGVVGRSYSNQDRSVSSNATLEVPAMSQSQRIPSPRPSKPGITNKVCPLNESRCAGECQPDLEDVSIDTRSRTPPSRSQWKTVSNSYPDDSDDSIALERVLLNIELQPTQEHTSPFPFDFGFNAKGKTPNTNKIENENRTSPLVQEEERCILKPEARRTGISAVQRGRIVDYRSATENIGYQSENQRQDFEIDPLLHTCNNGSSQTCQQCLISRQSSTAISPHQTLPAIENTKSSPTQDISTYPREPPMSDPIKQPSASSSQRKIKKRPTSVLSRRRSSTRVLRPVTNKKPTTKAASATSIDTDLPQAGNVSDKSVFRGLHVATAAACDEDLDKWIEDITGVSPRQFLADLSKFEGLGVNALAGVARRAARQRREEVRAWEEVRMERRGVRVDEGE